MALPTGSNYTVGFGSQIYYSTDGVSYTKVAQTRDIKGPDEEVGDVKITNNDSPANTKESAPGMIEPGEITWECVYTKAQQAVLKSLFGDGVIYGWREVFPDGSKYEANGYLKKVGVETKTEDEAIQSSVTVKLTTQSVFTAGS